MRASRTLMILEADTVDGVESNRVLCDMVSIAPSSGVCVVGMYKTVEPKEPGRSKLLLKLEEVR